MPKDNVITAWVNGEMELLIDTIIKVLDSKNVQIGELIQLVNSLIVAKDDTDGKAEKSSKKKCDIALDTELTKALKSAEEQFLKSGISSIDVALSGRMCTSSILQNVEAAMSMAHAITTHAMETEIDWFAAMDDLKEEADVAGAGHLNTQEFGAGVFYQYASIDIDLLANNLGKNREQALDVVSRYLRIMATTNPGGKQHSFASHSLAHCVMISKSDMPLSLANAFESPVERGRKGFVCNSTKAMLGYWAKIHKAYGINENAAVFSIEPEICMEDGLITLNTLALLQEWVKKEA